MGGTGTERGMGGEETGRGMGGEGTGRGPGRGASVGGSASVGESRAAVRVRLARRWVTVRGAVRDAGMATTEYAIVTVAAAGFGGLLLLILRSDEVRGLLVGLVRGALTP